MTELSTWNEPNVSSQPTSRHPETAARYYTVLRRVCPGCRVLAAEVLDNTDAPGWLRSFQAALPAPPRLWGLHNYEDANHFSSSGTDRVLQAVRGEIWVTETGGLVRYADAAGRVTFPPDERRAADATRFAFQIADAHPDRISRIYLYEWRSAGPRDGFDRGLLRADGTPRPAYFVLRDHLKTAGPPVPKAPSPCRAGFGSRGARCTSSAARCASPWRAWARCPAPGGSRCSRARRHGGSGRSACMSLPVTSPRCVSSSGCVGDRD